MKNKDIVYLNTAGLGIPPKHIINKRNELCEELYSDPRKEEIFKDRIQEEKTILNKYLFKQNSYSLSYLRNASEAIMISSHMFKICPGDEIITTTLDHRSNINQWLYVCNIIGAKLSIIEIPYDVTSDCLLKLFNEHTTPNTKIITFPHIDRNFGIVFPVKELCSLAHSKGIISIVDGAQSTGLINLDIEKYNCDVYLGSFHKWFLSPLALGYILVNERIFRDTKRTYLCGERFTQKSADKREFGGDELGSRDIVNELLLPSLLKYHQSYDDVSFDLIEFLNKNLKKINDIDVFPTSLKNRGIITFHSAKIDIDKLSKLLSKKYFIVTGSVMKFDRQWIRISIDRNNNEEDIMKLLDAVILEMGD
jgi:Selenocysteine lyase